MSLKLLNQAAYITWDAGRKWRAHKASPGVLQILHYGPCRCIVNKSRFPPLCSHKASYTFIIYPHVVTDILSLGRIWFVRFHVPWAHALFVIAIVGYTLVEGVDITFCIWLLHSVLKRGVYDKGPVDTCLSCWSIAVMVFCLFLRKRVCVDHVYEHVCYVWVVSLDIGLYEIDFGKVTKV